MKRKIAFLILIMAFLYSMATTDGEEIVLREQSLFTTEIALNPLAEKEIAVRVYNDWENDPCAYTKLHIPFDSLKRSPGILPMIFDGVKDSSVFVINPEDQKDEQIQEDLSGFVVAERWDKLKESDLIISTLVRDKKEKENVFICDAFGELIPDAKVDIYIRDSENERTEIFLTSMKTNDGLLQIPRISGSLRNTSFIISSPNYGKALVRRSINTNHVRTSLVHRDSLAYSRAIRGKVVDPEGNPVKNARIECTSARTLGDGLIESFAGTTMQSISNEDGTFCLYLPNEQTDERGYLIPPGSTYQTRVEAPKELNLVPYVEPITNDSEKTIVMEKAEYFRTFVFKDADGVITEYSKLNSINVNIMRSNKKVVNIGYNDLKEGGFFPLGEYKANMYVPGTGEYEFEPVLVDENSPEEIVIKLPEVVLYSGQVVHGLTGEPMSGAFVIAFSGSKKGNISMITSKQWDALHELPLEPQLDNAALKPITDIHSIKKIMRTDEHGYFQMSFIPGEIYGFITFEENYLTVMHRRHKLEPDENRIAKIPGIKLYPAATVLVELQSEERISVNPEWIINETDNPSWAKEFLSQDDNKEREYMATRGWLEQNVIQSFYIPAGLNVNIKFETPYDEQWCPIDFPDMLNLSQGQAIDLGSFVFNPAIEVFVQVINQKGKPVEGIPVRKMVKENHWGISHNSDESGISSFYVIPNTKNVFAVSYYGQDNKYMKENISCDIRGYEDAGKLFTLVLSDYILERLFDIAER